MENSEAEKKREGKLLDHESNLRIQQLHET